LAVFGVVTGCLLEAEKFAEIHEVMDHFYPGIMTIGLAAMLQTAIKEVERQVPRVKDFPYTGDYEAYGKSVLAAFGPTIELDGPLEINEAEVKVAFAKFWNKE
jgi:hypothetical protein